jgi:hypothetical protein
MLEEEGKYRAEVENQRNDLLKKLKEMEAQTVVRVGGDMIGVTVKHEATPRLSCCSLIETKELLRTTLSEIPKVSFSEVSRDCSFILITIFNNY